MLAAREHPQKQYRHSELKQVNMVPSELSDVGGSLTILLTGQCFEMLQEDRVWEFLLSHR